MSKEKKKIREIFRTDVFKRDDYKCRVCGYNGDIERDAHHITSREVMPHGGYVKENGISLCYKCHIWAEACLETEEPKGFERDLTSYKPENLYKLIGSSYEQAYEKSLLLK